MTSIIRTLLPYAILPLIASVIAWGIRGNMANAEVAKIRMAHSEQLTEWANASNKAATEALATSTQRIETLEGLKNDAIAQREVAVADLDRVRTTSNRLRAEYDKIYRDSLRRDPSLADGSPAAPSTTGMLAHMLSRAIDRAELLAGIADQSRIAGLTCERAYDALRVK